MPLPLAPILAAITIYSITKAVAALGFGFVVYTGLDFLQQQFYDGVSQNLGSTPAAILQVATLFGFVEYAKIVLGATSVKLSLMAFKRFMPI